MLVYKLILKGFIFPFGIALFSVLSILLLGRIVPLIDYFVRAGASFGELLSTSLLFLPVFLQFALPMAGLFGLLACFIKLTQLSEIIGIFAIGISPSRILYPSFLISLALFLTSLLISCILIPNAKMNAKLFIKKIGQKRLIRGIPEGRFFELSKGLVLFTNKNKNQGKKLKGVFIWDNREQKTPLMIYAKRGTITEADDTHSIILSLKDGILNSATKGLYNADILSFNEYSIKIGFEGSSYRKNRGEMGIHELMDRIKSRDTTSQKRRKYVSELIRRFTLPFGTLFLCLLAPPLGIFFGRSGLSTGVALGITAFLGYYLLTTLCTNMFETAAINNAAILLLPNLITAILSFMAWRTLFKRGPISLI